MLRLGSKHSFKFRGRHPVCTGSGPGPPVLSHRVLTAASLFLHIIIISRYFSLLSRLLPMHLLALLLKGALALMVPNPNPN